jgi:hypothetical protein
MVSCMRWSRSTMLFTLGGRPAQPGSGPTGSCLACLAAGRWRLDQHGIQRLPVRRNQT